MAASFFLFFFFFFFSGTARFKFLTAAMFSLVGGHFWVEHKLILVSYIRSYLLQFVCIVHKVPYQPLLRLSSAVRRTCVNEPPGTADGGTAVFEGIKFAPWPSGMDVSW